MLRRGPGVISSPARHGPGGPSSLQNWQGRAAPGLEGSIPSPRRGWKSGSPSRPEAPPLALAHARRETGAIPCLLALLALLSPRLPILALWIFSDVLSRAF